MIRSVTYGAGELRPYINWIYFFHAWGFAPRFAAVAAAGHCPACRQAWTERFDEAERPAAAAAGRLFADAEAWLRAHAGSLIVRGRFGLFAARAEGDDIRLLTDAGEEVHLPFLRQQRPAPGSDVCLCWSDFISPKPATEEDGRFPVAHTIGAFVTAAGEEDLPAKAADDYDRMLAQTLKDRLAEAAAEKMHEQVRRAEWGYAPDEALAPGELFAERYQGRRPAVGYPSLPDQSLIFLLDCLLDFSRADISLTETGMMRPHAAVAGLMLAHPSARHFSIGPIDDTQLADYAQRRGLPVPVLRRFLAGNLR